MIISNRIHQVAFTSSDITATFLIVHLIMLDMFRTNGPFLRASCCELYYVIIAAYSNRHPKISVCFDMNPKIYFIQTCKNKDLH